MAIITRCCSTAPRQSKDSGGLITNYINKIMINNGIKLPSILNLLFNFFFDIIYCNEMLKIIAEPKS